jgi:hypothetical protein
MSIQNMCSKGKKVTNEKWCRAYYISSGDYIICTQDISLTFCENGWVRRSLRLFFLCATTCDFHDVVNNRLESLVTNIYSQWFSDRIADRLEEHPNVCRARLIGQDEEKIRRKVLPVWFDANRKSTTGCSMAGFPIYDANLESGKGYLATWPQLV